MKIKPFTMTFGNRTIEISHLHLVLTDNNLIKKVSCQIVPTTTINGINRTTPIRLKPLTLWSNDQYDSIGDWTQEQAESRVQELLGDNIKAGLTELSINLR